ncbi:Transient receptor potential cation channel subfamily M member-like 2 [Lamellibrachia satsuma]|nr:Transient receptor potential cation channel subfamily M member-like 2 [Lamellibrachia satsuma]
MKNQFLQLLASNIHDVVKTKFTNDEVDIGKFVTKELLDDLFKDPKVKENSDKSGANSHLLYTLLEKESGNEIVEKVGKVVKKLLGYDIKYGDEKDGKCRYPLRDLFVWALLLDRRELAELFWENGINNIAMALVACTLLQALANTAEHMDLREVSKHFKDLSSLYEDRAIGVLHNCYHEDEMKSKELLEMELNACGNKSTQNIADIFDVDFLGRTRSDETVEIRWTRQLATDEHNHQQV